MAYTQQQLRGTLMAFFSGALFGMLGYLGTKLVYRHFSIENMLFWRFFVASLWISLWILLSKREQLIHGLRQGSLLKIFVLGAITYSASSLLYFFSSRHIGTGPAMVIFYSFPVFVALFAWLAGTWQFNKIASIAFIVVLLGLFLLKGSGEHSMDLLGIIFGLIAAISYAAYVHGSHGLKHFDATFLTLLVCCGNSLIFLLLSFSTSSFTYPSTSGDWIFICALGVISTALPIQLLLDGLKYISPVKASVIASIEPVITVIMGLALLNESLSLIQAMGILVVLIGALLIQFERVEEHNSSIEKYT